MQFHDYPFHRHFIDVGGVNLHYIDEGAADADPVLMVHGNPTWSYYFRHLITALTSPSQSGDTGRGTPRPVSHGQYRTIAPDHIGMGLSDKPDEDRYEYTLARRVTDLEKLLDHLDLQKPLTLVLHDWGGMIGMALATRRPDRIARIIVLNTSAFGLPAGKKMPWQLNVARRPFIGALLVRGFNAFSTGAVKNCVTRPLPKEVRAAYLAPYDTWQNRLAVHRFIQDIPLQPGDRAFDQVADVEKNLAQFQPLPMLICWGMKDFVFDIHFLNRWIERFPAALVHRFEDAGHYVLEDVGDQIIPLVQKFLDAHPLSRPA